MKNAGLALLALLLAVGTAHAWTALCDGCGGTYACSSETHEKMTQILMNNMSCLNNNTFNALDSGWADTSYARDGSGTVYIDEEYFCGWSFDCYGDISHNYAQYWPRGCAPENGQGFFDQSVVNGSFWGGYLLARGLHFAQDVANPYHSVSTDKIRLTCQIQDHAAYEGWVSANWLRFAYYYDQGVKDNMAYHGGGHWAKKRGNVADTASNSIQYWDELTNSNCDNLWASNVWATQQLMWLAGVSNCAYVMHSVICP